MSFLGGIVKSIVNPVSLLQVAMGPAGWASLAARTLFSAVGQQFIQQLGQRLGLPQSVIDMAQAQFAGSVGDVSGARRNIAEALGGVSQQFNLSPAEQGSAERDLNNAIASGANSLMERAPGKSATASVKGGWLMAIAEAMGKQLDAKGAQLTEMAGQITDKTPSLTTKFQAASQEFGLMMNALTTVLKTVGENVTATARKG